ncbi:MAG: C1 family peptidase [Bacteroidota bacterium]
MKKITIIISLIAFVQFAKAQDFTTNHKDSHYEFKVLKEWSTTDIKNQNTTSTCWTYSTESFLESEIIRMGKPKIDLSQMWIVRNAYTEKAINYVRRQGKAQFDEGGEPHDVMTMVKKYGIVPASVYPGGEKPDHKELVAVLKAYLNAIIEQPKLTDHWLEAFNGILDAYFGKMPANFDYDGKKFTPQSFTQYLGINPDDYVEITSFTHHPFYKKFIIEIADNWDNGEVYNVPLDEFTKIADNSIDKGYSIEWASDNSEKTFSFKNGVAIWPAQSWDDMSKAMKDSIFNYPVEQAKITQEMRQKAFDNLTTTDDHGMHIIGSATDQMGTPYFLVKNSWGAERNDLKGFFYCSHAYFQYKTTGIMVHKNAIPKEIAKKLGIQ